MLLLASTSPRRKELLEKAGVEFRVISSSYEEDMTLDLPPEELCATLAYGKAHSALNEHVNLFHNDDVILGADTIVVVSGKVLGKPVNADQAKTFLNLLSGVTHTVMTAICLIRVGDRVSRQHVEHTHVRFKTLSPKQIDEYIISGEWSDKAGGYAVQGNGAILIDFIEGDFTNVVGLPVEKTLALARFDVSI